jgi:hypothetical protein
MIPAHGRKRERLESFKGLLWPQRAGDTITQVDRGIDATAPDVSEHGFQSRKISVDV